MSKSHVNQPTTIFEVSPLTQSDSAMIGSHMVSEYRPLEQYLTFNILGKLYHVKQSLFANNSDLFQGTLFTESDQLEKYYDQNRQQYILDISPLIFETILQYYTTQKLSEPTNVHIDYFKKTLASFHIDSSSLDVDERFERLVPRQTAFQLIHVLLEYPNSCQLSQFLHYICSIIALLSCFLLSLSLTSRDSTYDLHRWNATQAHLPARSKSIIAHFHHRSSTILILDTLCLIWAIVETILRTLSTPSLYTYFTTIGLFDITGVVFHCIYIYMISTGTKPKRCQTNPIQYHDLFSCITFNRRLMMLNLLRKVRLVRYVRPLKHVVSSLLVSKKEVLRLIVLIAFIIAFLAPFLFIIESSHIHECTPSTHVPMTSCIRTITDAYYYLILIITTVGYGDIYPSSHLARFIAMLASPLSIMMLSVPLSSIYSRYISQREIYQMQLTIPENIRYLVYDDREFNGQDHQLYKVELIDVTEQINESLKYLGINRRLQGGLDERRK